jgi:hypothetical protein
MMLNESARAMFADKSSDELLSMLLAVDGVKDPSESVFQVRFWLLAYLEERHPVVTQPMNEWSLDLDSDISYCDMLAAVLRREGCVKP